MSSNVGAAPAVIVVGPSYAPFEARMIAAASAASSRAVHETGPSAGTVITPVSCHEPSQNGGETTPVGSLEYTDDFAAGNRVLINGTLVLADGKLTVDGLVPLVEPTVIPIVPGTGAYTGLTGTLTAVDSTPTMPNSPSHSGDALAVDQIFARLAVPPRSHTLKFPDVKKSESATGIAASVTPPPRASSPTLVLVMLLACQLMFTLDTSVIVTALPRIRDSLHFSASGLSWVQDAYTLAFGGLLLLGSRLGDILGRRRVFLTGVGVFASASLLAGIAPTSQVLILGRAVQGVAGAVAAPSTLSLLLTTFTQPQARARAIAMYSSVASGGTAVGLIVGGFLTSALSWRWGMFINVPIGFTIVVFGPRVLPETERRPGRFDVTGAVTSTLGMTGLVYGFVRAAEAGWSNSWAIGAFTAGSALMIAFLVTESLTEQPITPLRLFADRVRAGSYLARALINGGMFAFFFYISQYLEGARNYSPLGVGYAFLPLTLVMFMTAQLVHRIPARVKPATLISGGVATGLVGMIWLSRLSASTQFFPNIVLPMMMLGLGIGMAFIKLTGVSVSGVPQSDEGAASGLVSVSQQVGASLGLAVMVTVFGAATTRAATNVAATVVYPERQAQVILGHGTSAVLTGSAISIAVALLVSLLMVRTRSHSAARPLPAEDGLGLNTPASNVSGAPPSFDND